MNAREVIAANPFFAEVLGDAEIDRLAKWAHVVEKAAGEDLIVEDDAGTSLFIIVSGEVEVLTGDGRRSKRIARLGPGAVVGEMSLMTGARRSATVRAIAALHGRSRFPTRRCADRRRNRRIWSTASPPCSRNARPN